MQEGGKKGQEESEGESEKETSIISGVLLILRFFSFAR